MIPENDPHQPPQLTPLPLQQRPAANLTSLDAAVIHDIVSYLNLAALNALQCSQRQWYADADFATSQWTHLLTPIYKSNNNHNATSQNENGDDDDDGGEQQQPPLLMFRRSDHVLYLQCRHFCKQIQQSSAQHSSIYVVRYDDETVYNDSLYYCQQAVGSSSSYRNCVWPDYMAIQEPFDRPQEYLFFVHFSLDWHGQPDFCCHQFLHDSFVTPPKNSTERFARPEGDWSYDLRSILTCQLDLPHMTRALLNDLLADDHSSVGSCEFTLVAIHKQHHQQQQKQKNHYSYCGDGRVTQPRESLLLVGHFDSSTDYADPRSSAIYHNDDHDNSNTIIAMERTVVNHGPQCRRFRLGGVRVEIGALPAEESFETQEEKEQGPSLVVRIVAPIPLEFVDQEALTRY